MKSVYRSRFEQLEKRDLFATWQNPFNHFDVDSSGEVTPLDVLVAINDLNAYGARRLVDKPYVADANRCIDVNGDEFASPLDVLLVINALNRNSSPLNFTISTSPAHDLNGNGVVLATDVELRGQTSPNARLEFALRPLDALLQPVALSVRSGSVVADMTGAFSVAPELFVGLNQVEFSVTDELGRKLSQRQEIVRGDIVSDWNAALLNVVRDWTATSNDPYQGRIVPSPPPAVTRNLAMIHLALFEAMNSIENKFTSYLDSLAPELGSSPISAAAQAAYDVAISLYPGAKERAVWNATLAESLDSVQDGPSRNKGIEFGKRVAAEVLARRANDGSAGSNPQQPSTIPGVWNRTAPDFLPPLLPHWGRVRPFAVGDIASYRAPAPPELSSAAYAAAVDEVMRLGAIDSATRTEEQTEIAVFWSDGGGTATPPGHWNQIAARVSLAEQESTIDRARTFALLNLALADSAIAAWDSKYWHNFWRPIEAIRRASEDGNDATIENFNWLPLLRTPPHPAYVSGHSAFSAAAAAVLTSLYGENYAFGDVSDGHTGLTQKPLSSVTKREFRSFREAAEEAGMSRIYGGIHFMFDNTAGQTLGDRIARNVVHTWLSPVV